MPAAFSPTRRQVLWAPPSLLPHFSFTVLMIFALTVGVYAQDATGSLEGRLTDKSGAVIANVAVELRSVETNATRSQTSDADGLYRFVQLGVGHYILSVKAAGFAEVSQPDVEIAVSQTTRVDVELAPASVNESVMVTDASPAVDTSTNTLGKVVSGREVLDLPLNGRNFAQLGLLQTGVASSTRLR